MASSMNAKDNTDSSKKLSHKKWRAHLKKMKRKAKRTAEAKARDSTAVGEAGPEETDSEEERRKREEEDVESLRLNRLWMEREWQAQAAFEAKKEWEEKEKRRKEETERKIREEWEAREKKEKEDNEEKEKKEAERRDKQNKLLKEATANENTGEWHNPIGPIQYNNQSQEKKVDECPFFKKTATCRFGEQCSRWHDHPESSSTLLVAGMFSSFELEQSVVDQQDTDIGLEYDDSDMYHIFKDFYADVLPEFKKIGTIRQFKVCCNYEPHLRGNVYVQYKRESAAQEAFQKFNARWYGGRQLTCRFVNILSWKAAICGLAFQRRCPKGRSCNFLHVFRNPGNEFGHADMDRSPTTLSRRDNHRDRDGSHSHRSYKDHRSTRQDRDRRHGSVRSQGRRRSRSRSRSRSYRPSSSSRRSRSSSRSSPKRRRRKTSEKSGESRHRSEVRSELRQSSPSTGSDSGSPSVDKKNGKQRSAGEDGGSNQSQSGRSIPLSRSRRDHKDRSRSRSNSRENNRNSRSRSKSRQNRERSRSRSKSRQNKRNKSRSRSTSRQTHRDRTRSRSNSREENKNRSRSRSKSRQTNRNRSRSSSRSKSRQIDRSRSNSRQNNRNGRSRSQSKQQSRDRSRLRQNNKKSKKESHLQSKDRSPSQSRSIGNSSILRSKSRSPSSRSNDQSELETKLTLSLQKRDDDSAEGSEVSDGEDQYEYAEVTKESLSEVVNR